MSLTPPPARLIDPRGHRFGAGLSVILVVAAYLLGAPWVVALIAVALGVSAAFGTRYSALGRPWPYVRRLLRIGPPKELEHEYPPRFAQALGFVGLTLAVALILAGAPIAGWAITAIVGGLQLLLAATGYCLGCRLYFLRWWVPSLFQRLAR
jgi:hypothetical protein